MIVCIGDPTSGGHYETHLIAPVHAEGSVSPITRESFSGETYTPRRKLSGKTFWRRCQERPSRANFFPEKLPRKVRSG